MRYLKIYENYQTEEEEVAKICKQYYIINWSINQDGLVDVTGNVHLMNKKLKKIPLKFGIVSGDFYCDYNQLTTLEGAPESVGGDFYCNHNKLTTLEGAPRSVDGSFYCGDNKLTTLKGAPESVGGRFDCNNNKLTTLEDAPYSVGGDFYCHINPLPDLIKKNIGWIEHILTNQEMYHIYNKDGTINEYRFRLMMDSMD